MVVGQDVAVLGDDEAGAERPFLAGRLGQIPEKPLEELLEQIATGILRALEPDSGIDIANVEKNTIDSFMNRPRSSAPR